VKTGKVDVFVCTDFNVKCLQSMLIGNFAIGRDAEKGTWLTETVQFCAGF
jgi:hypothetical protein